MRFRRLAILLLLLAANGPAQEQDRPFPPHQVIGNVYFVGTASLGCFLVVTPQGNILINSGFEETVPVVRASIERLGFRFEDIKILLTSHAHDDHVGGHALVKKQTGARVLVMEGDQETVETGFGGRWAACPVDGVLHDGDQVTLGGVTLVAHHTPGHTPGCTSWSLAVPEGGRTYNVVIVGSLNVSSRLLGNTEYPEIVSDFLQSIELLERLPCDVFLEAHGSYYRLREKYAKLEKGGPNPFIDPEGYRRYIKQREEALLARLAEERKATRR
jgi:metallo-beta-lactamase class B